MKTVLRLLLLLISSGISAQQRTTTVTTTPDELVYLISGYREQLGSGADIGKEGYDFLMIDIFDYGDKRFFYRRLVEKKTGKTKGVSVIAHFVSKGRIHYTAIDIGPKGSTSFQIRDESGKFNRKATFSTLRYLNIICNSTSGTTAEELDFLTDGIEKPFDADGNLKKPGYRLEKYFAYNRMDATATFYKFILDESNEIKALFAIVSKDKNDKKRFVCIPLKDEKLQSEFSENLFHGMGLTMAEVFLEGYDAMLGILTDDFYNK
ncbi:MAG: hypothetical protein EOO50_11910 [Flavobacterium sp.]|uniref:hypothetical protein n=1 Tax=Flavobacterium sp. TaxID=239 RepID=UPI0012175B33|nr:hypothetical protein [Flavobacterium sp.]RZJ65964.1 MAG: hypothetical protein EOO50_11910 [Flavobacterium sp.]